MFTPRLRPLVALEDRLVSVRSSLNAPVVSTAELPPGPARAALVVHTEGGRRCFAVALRSLRNGTSVVYELEGEDVSGEQGWALAADAALSFGESMGFLFDDEIAVADGSEAAERALAALRQILSSPGPEASESAEEILLDDEVALELDRAGAETSACEGVEPAVVDPDPIHVGPGDPEATLLTHLDEEELLPPASDPGPAAFEEEIPFSAALDGEGALPVAPPTDPPTAVPAQVLTKFRTTMEPVPAPAAGAAGAARLALEASEASDAAAPEGGRSRGRKLLARLRPLRRRVVGEQLPPTSPLMRLLSSF